MTSPEPLVIPLRVRGTARFFPVIAIGLVVAAVAVIVFSRSLEGIIWSALLIVAFSWIGVTMLAARRTSGAAPRQIVATTEGLRSHVWEITWDQVERLWIGYLRGTSQKTLAIELRGASLPRTRSTVLTLNLALSRAVRAPEIQILQSNVDRPVEDIAADLERLAGRSLLA